MSKYRAVQTVIDGKKFASKKEARRWGELRMLECAGYVFNLRTQVPYILVEKSQYGRAVKYIADFVYEDENGDTVVEDTKGFKTDVYKLKKRLMAEKYGIIIKET